MTDILQYPDFVRVLHDVGGWVFAAVVLSLMLLAAVKGVVIPRFVYDEQRIRADKAESQQDSMLESLGKVAKSVDNITTALIARSGSGREES